MGDGIYFVVLTCGTIVGLRWLLSWPVRSRLAALSPDQRARLQDGDAISVAEGAVAVAEEAGWSDGQLKSVIRMLAVGPGGRKVKFWLWMLVGAVLAWFLALYSIISGNGDLPALIVPLVVATMSVIKALSSHESLVDVMKMSMLSTPAGFGLLKELHEADVAIDLAVQRLERVNAAIDSMHGRFYWYSASMAQAWLREGGDSENHDETEHSRIRSGEIPWNFDDLGAALCYVAGLYGIAGMDEQGRESRATLPGRNAPLGRLEVGPDTPVDRAVLWLTDRLRSRGCGKSEITSHLRRFGEIHFFIVAHAQDLRHHGLVSDTPNGAFVAEGLLRVLAVAKYDGVRLQGADRGSVPSFHPYRVIQEAVEMGYRRKESTIAAAMGEASDDTAAS